MTKADDVVDAVRVVDRADDIADSAVFAKNIGDCLIEYGDEVKLPTQIKVSDAVVE